MHYATDRSWNNLISQLLPSTAIHIHPYLRALRVLRGKSFFDHFTAESAENAEEEDEGLQECSAHYVVDRS